MEGKTELHSVAQKCVLSGCKHDVESCVENLDSFAEILSSVLSIFVCDYFDCSPNADVIGQFHDQFSCELSMGTHHWHQ